MLRVAEKAVLRTSRQVLHLLVEKVTQWVQNTLCPDTLMMRRR